MVDPSAGSEREQTDTSLQEEREKTDSELERHRALNVDDADDVVRAARSRAVAVIEAARAVADSEAPRVDDGVREHRATEDAALRDQYRSADAQTSREREGVRRALAVLVGHERAMTDEMLLVERDRADTVLASRDEFLGMVAHDLRTLLSGISLNAAILVRNAKDDEVGTEVRRGGDRIQRFTERMDRLVSDLIDVVSIDAGKLLVVPRTEKPQRLVMEMAETFHAMAAGKGLLFSKEIAPDIPRARFDFDRALQVLANLVSNAIKFTPSGGRIVLRLEPAGDFVRFSVTDTGQGIEPDKVPLVFERFWQAAGPDGPGLGLGLYISKCLVDAQGGSIGVESTPGSGSTFSFTLPVAPYTSAAPPHPRQ